MTRIIALFFIVSTFLFSPEALKAENNASIRAPSKAFANVGKKAIPAVVFIKTQYDASNNQFRDSEMDDFEFFQDDFFKKFFGSPPNQFKKQEPKYAAGSGCLVSQDGYILTNNHIVKDATGIKVTLNNGQAYDAKIIGTDPKTDLAVIKIDANNLPYLQFANADQIEIGEWAIAIGSPFQLQASLTVGVVSATGRQNLRITDLEDFIQTDAAINPGNSGGPLLDIDAKIIGINTAIVSQSGGYMGIGFSIPSNMAKHIMQQIIDNGSVKRGHLGIYLQPIDKEMAEALDLNSTEAVLVAEVAKQSAAEKAGIKQGDIIIAYNDIKVKNDSSFRKDISLMSPGDKVKLTIIRNGKKKYLTVQLGESPDALLASNKFIELGLEVTDIKDISPDILKKRQYSDNIEGVMITSIKQSSLAQRSGLKPGMLIMQINHKKIKNISDFNESLKDMDKRRHLLVLVKYQNITKFITIRLK